MTTPEPSTRQSPERSYQSPAARLTRMDMHVHSRASRKPVIAALRGLACPESFSPPERVYEQARARGMDLVTLTDHDTIEGALELIERGFEGVVLGEEVTTFFPEDRCKLHVLLWGHTPEQHEAIGRLGLRDDVYAFAHWLAENNLAHSFAHPLYIQNGRLTLWHLERCCLLFKAFERLNGAHSGAHVDGVSRLIAALTPKTVQKLIDKHGIEPVWSRTWLKPTTAGSDDHALLNVGCTWTGVAAPDDRKSRDPQLFLREVMAGKAVVGGQAGHSALLAHQLTTVGLNYYAERWHAGQGARARAFGSKIVRFAGIDAEPPSRLELTKDAIRSWLPGARKKRSALPILKALRDEIGPMLEEHADLRECLAGERLAVDPALAHHERMAAFTDELSERLMSAMAPRAVKALKRRDPSGLLDVGISYASVLAAQAPHIFSLFHQNKERRLLRQIERMTARQEKTLEQHAESMRVMLFTDTLADVNGVSRFIQNMGDEGARAGRSFHIVTSTRFPTPDVPHINNFRPLFARAMPGYEQLEIALPPLLRMLRLADQIQPDVIHISTPGPVGLAGLLASKMLHTPVLGVYHTDFPAYIDHLFEDAVYTRMTRDFMRFFYRSFSTIFARSDDYIESLIKLGLPSERMLRLTPGIAIDTFHTRHRDPDYWARATDVSPDSVKALYVGRVSVEKNLPLLTEAWPAVRRACAAAGREVELVVVGDGPYRKRMQKTLAGKGAHFLGFRHAEELSTIYATSDLFVFPSMTDTLGQVVLESQASGLPVLVSDQGGPKEVVAEGITGHVLPGDKPAPWISAMSRLLLDGEARSRMGRSAHTRAQRFSLTESFDHFWRAHADAWSRSDISPVDRRSPRHASERDALSGTTRPA